MHKLEIYNNKRIKVTLRDFNCFAGKTEGLGNPMLRRKGFMTQKEYFRTLRRWCSKLFEYEIDSSKCKFITLTLAEDMDGKTLMLKFTAFMNSVKNNFGRDVKYIRGVEVQRESKYFHIHLILVFEDELPTSLNSEWVKKHGKYGFIYVDDNVNVYDIYSLMNYLTLYKLGKDDLTNEIYTKFPCGARILSSNIEEIASKRIEYISDEELEHLCYIYENNLDPNVKAKPRVCGHMYLDEDDRQVHYTRDKIFIQSSEDFIEANYGLEEENKKEDVNIF